MIVRIKRHLLLLLLTALLGVLIAYLLIHEMQGAQMNQLFSGIHEAVNDQERMAYMLGMIASQTKDYTMDYWLSAFLFMGVANGYYFVFSYVKTQKKSPLYVFLAFIGFPIVGFVGGLSVLPVVLYELYKWIIQKQSILYWGLSQEVVAYHESLLHYEFENEAQRALVKQYMRTRKGNIFVFGTIVFISWALAMVVFFNKQSSSMALVVLAIWLFVSFFIALMVYSVLQSKNLIVMTTYVSSGEITLLKETYAYIMAYCTNDIFNANERLNYTNALLLSGDYDALRIALKDKRIAKNSPIRWSCERRLAFLDHDESSFLKNGEKLRAYYQRFKKGDKQRMMIIQNALLDLDIRDDLFYERYDEVLSKAITKAENGGVNDKLILYYQLGISYYHLHQLDLAKENFLKLQALSTTHGLYLEIEPLLKALM